jgi:hypothetical protein
MEARTRGLRRLRIVGVLGIAGGATLLLSLEARELGAWLFGAATAAELCARLGSRRAGEWRFNTMWIAPTAGLAVALAGGTALYLGAGAPLGVYLALFGMPVALAWGVLLGALCALVDR